MPHPAMPARAANWLVGGAGVWNGGTRCLDGGEGHLEHMYGYGMMSFFFYALIFFLGRGRAVIVSGLGRYVSCDRDCDGWGLCVLMGEFGMGFRYVHSDFGG